MPRRMRGRVWAVNVFEVLTETEIRDAAVIVVRAPAEDAMIAHSLVEGLTARMEPTLTDGETIEQVVPMVIVASTPDMIEILSIEDARELVAGLAARLGVTPAEFVAAPGFEPELGGV